MSLDFRFEMFIFKPAVSKTGKRVDSEKAAMPEIGDKSTGKSFFIAFFYSTCQAMFMVCATQTL